MRWGLLAVLMASCYQPPQSAESCSITCTEGVPDNCPGDLVCDSGYCVGPGQVCRPTFVQTTAGTGFGCAIDDAGAVWCWGKLTQTTVATRVETTRRWDLIDAGGGQICGIADGALYCWGENDDREVSGTVVGDVAEPLLIEATGIGRWSTVSAGVGYTCGIGDGKLLCWGRNDFGQLGDDTTVDKGVPTPVTALIEDWTAVAAGDDHTCATSTNYGVHCWGRDIRGELGPNSPGGQSNIPVSVTSGGTPLMATQVAVAHQSSCAITPAGELTCWGLANSGQLGERDFVDYTMITQIAEPQRSTDITGFTAIEGANAHFCALVADAIYCWGEAINGGLANGIWADRQVFSKVIAAGATGISVGQGFSEITNANDLDLGCAVVDGSVMCWGDNRYGQLGQGTTTLAESAVEVVGDHRFTTLSAGAQHICGIGDDQTLYCWGSTERGQATGFVYGTNNPRTPCAANPTDPTQPLCDVGAPRALSYAPNPVAVATGNAHTCALSNGVTSCWGAGLPGGPIKRDLPQPGGGTWKALLQTGRNGQCGTSDTMNDPVYCIGGVLSSTNNPVRVAQLDGFRAIALGSAPNEYGLFLDGTGLLQGYGDNSDYQLGDGTQNNYGTLTPIGSQTYSAISAKSDFACGLRDTDQKIACWGAASRGQTGASDTSNPTTTPNEVMNLSSCTAITTGVEHACAICSDTVYCWGDNRSAQLGAPQSDEVTSVPRSVTLPGGADVPRQLVAGSRFTCARTESGRTFCWGLSERGALGTGGTGSNLPITVRASQP